MDIFRYIDKLLNLHDYVIIPGFGGFVANYKAASVHPVVHHLSPPSKSLAFNKNLKANDGLLVGYIAQKEKLGMEEAASMVANFVTGCFQKLKGNEVIHFTGVGKLFSDIENNIRFVQDLETNHLIQSFGLPGFDARLVVKKTIEPAAAQEAIIIPIEETERKRKSPILRFAVAGLFLITLSAIATYYLTDISFQHKTESILGLDSSPIMNDTQLILEKPAEIKAIRSGALKLDFDWSVIDVKPYIENPEVNEVDIISPPDVISYPVSVNTDIPKGYFAIMGCFGVESNARGLAEKLLQDNREAYVFPKSGNGLMRVGVFIGSDNESKAQIELDYLRQNYQPDAWLVKNK